jgi:ParB-like chromosome segregation protein Spo0J
MKDIRRTARPSSTSYLPHEIELWEIERLTTNPKNARKHSTEQIRELAASMSAFGFMSAVVAGSDGIVLAGNARVLAARELGLRIGCGKCRIW